MAGAPHKAEKSNKSREPWQRAHKISVIGICVAIMSSGATLIIPPIAQKLFGWNKGQSEIGSITFSQNQLDRLISVIEREKNLNYIEYITRRKLTEVSARKLPSIKNENSGVERPIFGDIRVISDISNLDISDLKSTIKRGDTFSAAKIEKAVDTLTFSAGEKGFAFVDVRPTIDLDSNSSKLNVSFYVKEGPRTYLQRIDLLKDSATLHYEDGATKQVDLSRPTQTPAIHSM